MTITLHLGVIDVPYSNRPRSRKPSKSAAGTKTTGDVAEILEARYGIMETFFDQHGDDIAGDLEEGIIGAVESMAMGAPVTMDPFGSGLSKIKDRFSTFLFTGEMEKLGIAGVPTKAALRGVSHRFKRPYVRRQARASFIDTGLYETSFRAWID